MSTRQTRRKTTLSAADNEAVVAGQGTNALMRGLEAMRKIQERSTHEALTRHTKAAAQLAKPIDPMQFVKLQGDLVREDVEAFAKCWQEIAAAALEMQSEIAACSMQLVDTDKVLEAAAKFGH